MNCSLDKFKLLGQLDFAPENWECFLESNSPENSEKCMLVLVLLLKRLEAEEECMLYILSCAVLLESEWLALSEADSGRVRWK